MTEESARSPALLSISIDRSSTVAIYQQIYDSLRRRIMSGQLVPGEALPNQEDFSKQLAVNHITLRNALKRLADDGYIIRKRGRGSFILPSSHWKSDNQPKRLGIIVLHLLDKEGTENYWSRVYATICGHAVESGMTVTTYRYSDPELASRICEDNLDGVIAFASLDKSREEALAEIEVPKLILELETRQPGLDNVVIDCHAGAYEGVNALLHLGHRKLCYVGGLTGEPHAVKKVPQDSLYRLKAFREALEDAGIGYTPASFAECSFEQDDADALIADMLKQDTLPTAFFAFDDEIACYLINALKKNDLQVPADVSVLGFGNLPGMKTEHELATVAVDWQSMGQLAVQRIGERMTNGGMGGMTIRIRTWFKPGASVGPPSARTEVVA